MYKKLLLVILSVIALQSVKAQTEKGSQNLGVTFGISTGSTKQNSLIINNLIDHSNVKQKNYSISPDYSYFIANKLDIGVGLVILIIMPNTTLLMIYMNKLIKALPAL